MNARAPLPPVDEPRVGFLCVWDPVREATWSHIPSSLLTALQAEVQVIDLPVEGPPLWQRGHAAYNRRLHRPLWVPTGWVDGGRRVLAATQVRKAGHLDAILEINELTRVRGPFWIYRDMTWEQDLEYGGDTATGAIDARLVRARARRERRLWRHARGVFTFSRWAAHSVQRQSDVPVHVVPPGVNVRTVPRAAPRDSRCSFLFVGTAFDRKGGPETVRAFSMLHQRRPDLVLVVAGPGRWPLPGEVPSGVRFLGNVSPDALTEEFDRADVFVLPSHFEAFGIAFVEALASGLPCVARDACAMPEIVRHGDNGVLVTDADDEALAQAMERALDDDAMHGRVVTQAPEVRAFYTWARAAKQMMAVMLD